MEEITEPIHIISLGAGVQSSTMALMAAHGEITPMPKCAIFADTGDEPESVYNWLDELEPMLPFAVHRVMSHTGKLSANLFRGNHSQIPAFMANSIGKRQCTNHWKLRPIRREVRRISLGKPVNIWIGISLDEISRMKPSGVRYVTNVFPLIDRRIRRYDCERWLRLNGYPVPPKSACVYCPYHSDSVWREIKKSKPDWQRAVAIDRALNKRGEFVHSSLLPLDQVDFSTDEDHGQQVMFGNECEGMCGV